MLKKIRVLKTPVKWTILGTTGLSMALITGSELYFISWIIGHFSPFLGFVGLTCSVFSTSRFSWFLFKEYKKDFGGQNGY
jgi:hypothetical protein